MKKRLVVVLALVAAVACAAIAVPAFAATKTVKVGPQTKFGTRSLSIKRGDTVRFRWTGTLSHNVRISKGPVRKQIASARTKGTVPFTFTRKGTYTVVCDVHAPEMKMTIRVG